MKRVLATMAAAVAPAVLVYAGLGFTFWQFSPAMWSSFDRGFAAFIAVFVGFLFAGMVASFPGWDHRK